MGSGAIYSNGTVNYPKFSILPYLFSALFFILEIAVILLIGWIVWKLIISKIVKNAKESNAYALETNRIKAEAERTKAEALKKIADNIENAPEEWKEQKKEVPKYL